MGFYIRKSVSAGPFRFNFSKGGIGASVGVKGLRVGTGPRGAYIHAGRGGFYYKTSLGKAGQSRGRRPSSAPTLRHDPAPTYAEPGVEMVEIESADVLEMSDARFADILAEIRAKEAQMRKAPLLAWMTTALAVATLLTAPSLALVVFLGIWPAYALGKWLDSYQRRTVLYYDLEPEAEEAYSQFASAFQNLVECRGKWHVSAGGYVNDLHTWKRNAGASRIVDKKPTTVGYGLPPILASNISPPMAKVGRQTLYFLPDVALVIDGKSVGAVGYPDLTLRWEDSNFIETGAVPSDTQVIGHTWKHPNKNGGPDRRFRDNHQIPICRYEVLHLSSASGLNELLEFSRTGVSGPLADAQRTLANLLGRPAGIEQLRLAGAS